MAGHAGVLAGANFATICRDIAKKASERESAAVIKFDFAKGLPASEMAVLSGR